MYQRQLSEKVNTQESALKEMQKKQQQELEVLKKSQEEKMKSCQKKQEKNRQLKTKPYLMVHEGHVHCKLLIFISFECTIFGCELNIYCDSAAEYTLSYVVELNFNSQFVVN